MLGDREGAAARSDASVVVLRHGATEWSTARRHTGRTDVPLSPEGERQAIALAPVMVRLAARGPLVALTSPLRRARRTAELAGLVPYTLDEDLVEWDYGAYEGLTTTQIRTQAPGWTVFTQPCPGGETARHVARRCDRVLGRIAAASKDDPTVTVVAVAHSHLLRSLAARWLGRPVSDGGVLELGVASMSVLGHEHGVRTLRHWNLANPLAQDPFS
jgi:broad specificity phosphatase PhoE